MDEVRNSPRMIFPRLLLFAIGEDVWPAAISTSYRSELATPFRRSKQVLTGCFAAVNYER
jgi:hypothetical protein